MIVRVVCINKDDGDHYDPHEAITYLGCVRESDRKTGKMSRMKMVEYLKKGNQAYVKDSSGRLAYLVVRVSRAGNEYVKTIADGKETNNLLELPECK